jgi:DcmR-like sensory protein/histidine kinase-like protein
VGFTHQLLAYDCADSFLTGTVPFVRAGLDGGDTVLAVTGVANQELLRGALGTAADHVEFVEAAEWYRSPARTLAQGVSRAEGLARAGGRLRLVSEPVWRGWRDFEVTEWQRTEAMANIAYVASCAALLCLYNDPALPAEVVAGARATHPETLRGDAGVPNPGYLDPWTFSAEADLEPLPPAPDDAELLQVKQPDLYWLRAYVADFARGEGMAETELQRLLVAVTEVATNALRHGTPPYELRIWTEHGELVCDVADGGLWESAKDFGFLPPDPAGPGRFGLWAVRLLCSLVQIRTGRTGTIVRLRLPLA